MRSLLLLIASLAWVPTAFPHHFKGLPHFSYFENYPQVPQDEFLAQSGDYECSLVLYDFQGIKRSETQQPNNARFYLIAYDMRDNTVYNGPLTMTLLDGDNPTFTRRMESSQEESIYTLQKSLPETGDYSLRVTLHDEDNLQITIPFLLSSQKVPWGRYLLLSIGVCVGVVAVGSRRARVVQDRREAHQKKNAGKPNG